MRLGFRRPVPLVVAAVAAVALRIAVAAPAAAPAAPGPASEVVASAAAPATPDATQREAAARLIAAARGSNRAWELLARLCDEVGGRPASSPAYDKAVAWALAEMKAIGLENPRPIMAPVRGWRRGPEELLLLAPGPARPLPVTTLGRSVATPAEGIEAAVVVLPNFKALEERKDALRGKIVLFNDPMKPSGRTHSHYGEAVQYRVHGAGRAAAHGAVAVLVRSVTTAYDRAPHTGVMSYPEGVPQIPAAAITVEDADALQRLQDRGIEPRVRLRLLPQDLGPQQDPNVVAELRGRERPEEIVVVGAHLDSWDLACGAHDDGAGVVLSLQAVRLLKELGLVPRRTVRVVLFANEERGLEGALGYRDHVLAAGELERHVAALEADAGAFQPTSFGIDAGPGAVARLEAWHELFAPLGALEFKAGGSAADVSVLAAKGVPALGLNTDTTHYFDYHHAPTDTPDKVVPAELNDALAAYTLMTWLLADAPDTLPRKVPATPATAAR